MGAFERESVAPRDQRARLRTTAFRRRSRGTGRGSFDGGVHECAQRASPEVRNAPRGGTAIQRTWSRRSAAWQPLSTHDGKRGAGHAGGRLGGRLPIFRHRAALRAWALETRLNGFLRPKPRDSYLISTKVGRLLDLCEPNERSGKGKFFETPSRRERFDYSYDGVMRSLELSLERLGLDHIDIVYGHDVDITTHGSKEASDARIAEFMSGGYRALDELRASGAIKAIGAGINDWEVARRWRARETSTFSCWRAAILFLSKRRCRASYRCARKRRLPL